VVAFGVVTLAEWILATAVAIEAYDVGGALAVGLVGFRLCRPRSRACQRRCSVSALATGGCSPGRRSRSVSTAMPSPTASDVVEAS
jgi:hypothetical protein